MHVNGKTNGHHIQVPDDVPVLIIGGGPSGLLQAYLLAQLGVRSLVVERYARRLAAPKAHALSPRSLEICRQSHLDVNYIRSLGSQRADAFWVNFVTSLDGEHVGRLPYERMDTSVLDDTPEMIHNIPQPDFEQIISDQLPHTGLVEVRRNFSFISSQQEGDHVYTVIEDRSAREHLTIRSRFVIACDGAKSRVRQFLGIESEGEDSYETMMTIHFHADMRPVVGPNVGILHWLMDPAVSGFIIGYDLKGNQVLICNFDPERHPVSSWDEAHCLSVLRAAMGENVHTQVRSWRPWILSRKIANQYRVGNVFLAGDAAHSFPPTGGLGLNSALADVHNLAYKVAFVLQGRAGDSLLDTYEGDRRHVAKVNALQSVKNGKKIFGLLKALGTTTTDISQARRNLHDSIHDTEKRKKIHREIEEQQEHFDNLELHIGYVYGSSAVPPHASHYTAKYMAGARLPHAWIRPLNPNAVKGVFPANLSYVSELSGPEIEARKYSTLDLCSMDSFTLIQPKSPLAKDRSEAAIRLLSDVDGGGDIAASPSAPLLRIVTLGVDFDVLSDSPAGEIFVEKARLRTDNGAGGILVRPDQHVLLMLGEETGPGEIHRVIKAHLFGSA